MTGSGSQRRSLRTTSTLLALALCVLAQSTPLLAAFWYENYDEAEKALRAEDWARAVQLLEQAIQEKGESGVGVRTYGMNFIDYFPYLKLGIAHYRLGNYDAALAAFDREERLGAIGDSRRDQQELVDYRDLTRQAREQAAAQERDRVVTESMARARALETEGRLDDAIAELGKALAVDPQNAEADAAMARLQTALTLERDQQERENRFNGLLEQGRQLLAQQSYGEAAGALAQAAQLKPDSSEAKTLLEQAQAGLATRLQAAKDAEERSKLIADGLRRAEQLEADEEFASAIAEIQAVLALDPGNAQAVDLQQRLLLAQEVAETSRIRSEGVQALLDQIEQSLQAGEFDRSLSLVNRVLSTDPLNRDAIRLLRQAQQGFRAQIETVGATTLAPLIAFDDDRRQAGDPQESEQKVESASYPNFQLSGAVYSSTLLASLESTADGAVQDLLADGEAPVRLADGQYLTRFQLDRTLVAGLSTFLISATDADGKRASRDYAVLYRVPFYVSTWFYVVLVVMAFVVAGVFYARSVMQRREKLKRRFNPYIAGAPVIKEEQYFGREDLMHRVLQSVHNNSILLYGERRIGKTSFQHRLMQRLQGLNDPDFTFYPVFIDLQGTPETKFFATLAHDMFDELAPVLDGIQPHSSLQDRSGYGYRELVRDIRSVLQALNKRGGKRAKLVLLIDEVDELNYYDPRVNQRLRSLFMKSFAEDLVAVVSGVGIKKKWESEGSPWYNFFEEIEIKPFRRQDAVELIEKPVRGVFKLEPGVTDRIIDRTDCKPYLIQKLCVALVNKAHEEQRRTITLADVDGLARRVEEQAS